MRSEVARAADRDGLRRVLDLDPIEDVVDAVADLADLRRRGRVGCEQLVGERAGADLPGADLAGAAGGGAEDHLGRAAADVDDADRPVDRMAEGLGRADEGEAALLLVAEDVDLDAGGRADLPRRPLAIARLAHRGGRYRANRLGAELTRQADLGGDDLGDLLDLVGTDRSVVVDRLVDSGVGALLHHLFQLAVDRLRHEHARRIGADIYCGAEHPGGSLQCSQTSRISIAGVAANEEN